MKLLIQIIADIEVIEGLFQVSQRSMSQSSEEEIFGNILLRLRYGLDDILKGLVEFSQVQVDQGPVIKHVGVTIVNIIRPI